jgi:Cdc6-like AAA superfamily ATPase
MVEGPGIEELRKSLVERTARLIEFLRDLASSRTNPVLDVDKHREVHWLADLPPQADLVRDAVAGESFLFFDPVNWEPPPAIPEGLSRHLVTEDVSDSILDAPALHALDSDVVVAPDQLPPDRRREYDLWLSQWQVWADADRRTAPQRHWYEALLSIHQQLDQHSDEIELVAATGMLSWLTPSGRALRTHLLSTRLQLHVDSESGRIEVHVDADATTRIADRDLLKDESEFDALRGEPVRQALREAISAPFDDRNKELLEQWRSLSLSRCRPYEHDRWIPFESAESVAQIAFAPALVLRERDAASLLGYYDAMLQALSGPDAVAPLGLAQLLVALETDERLAWLEQEGNSGISVGDDPLFPLPSNDEQQQIIGRLRHDNGVVVQGPPGTGKSHSIANLISALVAQGMRVLVTSQKAQALRVLRDKLPDDIAELCVSMTDLSRGGSNELNKSVNALSERFASFNPSTEAAKEADLSNQRDSERQRVATTIEQIRALRESETYVHPEIAAGYSGTLATIGRRLKEQESSCGWMPVPLPPDTNLQPPLTVAEVGELRQLLVDSTPQRVSRCCRQD